MVAKEEALLLGKNKIGKEIKFVDQINNRK